MTIGELLGILTQYPLTTMVVVRGYEQGFDNANPREVELVVDDNWVSDPTNPYGGEKPTWYYGRHTEKMMAEDGAPTIIAVCI